MASATTSRRVWQEALVRRLIARHAGLDPETIIERYAETLRAQAAQDALPVRVDLIASLNGIRRRTGRHGFAGRIYVDDNGQLVMDLNERDTEARQRFSEAHELIHTAFPGFRKERRYRSDATAMDRHPPNREEEYLCDYGAAALLMPAKLVAHEYSIKSGLRDAERLATDAEVSIEAAANRIVALSDEPAVLLCMSFMNKPADRAATRRGEDVPQRLRVRYAFSRHLDLYVPRFKGADESSVYCQAASSRRIEEGIDVLPGAEDAGLFRITAKSYGTSELARVLALGRPTA